MRPFDLVVLDLDGTILNPFRRTTITPAVQDAIAAVQSAGIPVTIGTGRTLDYLRHYFPGNIKLTQPAITAQGAIIGDPQTGEVLAEAAMPLAEAQALAHWIDRDGVNAAIYFQQHDGSIKMYRNQHGRSSEEEEMLEHLLAQPPHFCTKIAPLIDAPDAHPPIKVLTYEQPEQSGRDIALTLQAAFAPGLSIMRTHRWLVEATAQGVDKGYGLRHLCALLAIDPARVMAIGDSENDIPMLQAAGFAVAMGNATDDVKAVADWIAPTIEEDGVAVALQQWILNL